MVDSKQLRFITIGNKDVGKTAIVEKFLDPSKKLDPNFKENTVKDMWKKILDVDG